VRLSGRDCVRRGAYYFPTMIGKLLNSSEFGQWTSFVSPAFLEVMPAKALWQRFTALARHTRDRELYARAVAEREGWLVRSRLPVSLAPRGAPVAAVSGGPADPFPPQARAAAVVALYFHQLLHGKLTLLDLRQPAFTSQAGRLVWRPAAWIASWDTSFIEALRAIYAGFYGGDAAGFQSGLVALNLLHAEDVFRLHFGDGQHAVRFEVKHFVSTFHQVFVRCRDQKTRLHPDFSLLGLYLASLYDHLERLGESVDVAAAFDLARSLGAAHTAYAPSPPA
jgi:hypothetical protein